MALTLAHSAQEKKSKIGLPSVTQNKFYVNKVWIWPFFHYM